MNALAIYYVNQHLIDLQDEARRARLAAPTGKPSRVARLVAAVRSAFSGRSNEPSPTAASAA